MVRRNYEALVSGDGACAGCGEKSILRAAASVTEAYMRPLYHKKATRLYEKTTALKSDGVAALEKLKAGDAPRDTSSSSAPSPTSWWGSAARARRTPTRASTRTARSPTKM